MAAVLPWWRDETFLLLCSFFSSPFTPFIYLSPSLFYSLENESDPQAQQGPRQEVFVTDTAFGLRVTTTITYREVQPPITRLLRRVKSFFYPNDVPPSENWVDRKLRTLCWSWLVWESHPGAWHLTAGGKLLHCWSDSSISDSFTELAGLIICSDHCYSLHMYSNY